ncbi:hypothetical protein B0920_03335 [Massilia sp. KIM]|uniref:pirin family protein n=1 Tax=Massilia sp. KIM TaxID=1955422 RepID=UPI00098EB898|nr:pirin family protein [Massilia sp. KIM]OON62501.1 hypothetical protein B0920_03335 [Massilia sp. KIM]
MVELIIPQRRRSLGGGLEIGRVLPFVKQKMVGPFIFFDHMGPLSLPKGISSTVDVRAHPHIGLSTVTYLFSGEMMHRDSLGYEQAINPREVNWMTAGKGITHSERFERARAIGDHLHGIQAWVALPFEYEEISPSFSHHADDDLPQWRANGIVGQLIAGSAYGLTANVKTLSPLFYAHLDMMTGAIAEIPDGYKERAIYIASGSVEVSGSRYGAGNMLILSASASSLRALEDSIVMLLGGEPVGPRYLYWNFVSSSEARIAQAVSDWQTGSMKLPDADDAEFIPLPEKQSIQP